MKITSPTSAAILAGLCVLCLTFVVGCRSSAPKSVLTFAREGVAKAKSSSSRLLSRDRQQAEIAQVTWQQDSDPTSEDVAYAYDSSGPRTSSTNVAQEHLRLTLDEAVTISIRNAPVLRSLNGQVINNPQLAPTIFDPAIQSTDANFGIEAALSAFDANLTASLNHANNDDVFNNSILGGGATEVVQDLTQAQVGINKITGTGTQFSFAGNVVYDNNDNFSSTFPSSYTAFWQAQARKPLLQGKGTLFNQIAGPSSSPGFLGTSGVLISRINHEISVAQFKRSVNDHISEIVQAYWDLYFAGQNFKTAKLARDNALRTCNSVKARFDNNLPGGEADAEAQAREVYFDFESQLVTALDGNPRTGVIGVYQAEANLRRLIGMPQSDSRLIWPTDSPNATNVVWDWHALSNIALNSRLELKEQQSRIRQRELELLASKNFLLPRLDAVATFRNNGFGDRLVGGDSRFSSALTDLASGDHNEWELGLQMDMPIGFRRAHAGVRNSELELRREKAVLDDARQQILHDLGSAMRRANQAQRNSELNRNRMKAARDAYDARLAAFEAETVSVDLLLDAVQRLAEATNRFQRSMADYQVAQANISGESGTLLRDFAVFLDEFPE